MLLLSIIFEFLISLMNCIEYIMIGYIILGWFIFFGVLKNQESMLFRIYVFLMNKIEPLLGVIRRFLPSVGGLDFSPLVVFIGLHFAKVLILKIYFLIAYA